VAQGKADEAILTASIIEIEQWRVHYKCCEASQLFAAETSCTWTPISGGTNDDDELTFKLDHLKGAGQEYF